MGKLEEIAEAAEKLRNGEKPEVIDEADDVEGDTDDGEKGDKKEASPPGFKSYEDYIKDGGDPKKYKGEEAYSDYHKILQELKDTKKEFKTFSQQLLTANQATLEKDRARIKAELEETLKQQKKDFDVDGIEKTAEALADLKKLENKGAPPMNPVLVEFVEENPLIDKNSDEFNKEFFDDMALLQKKEIDAISSNKGADLTDAQILKCTKRAFEKAKSLNPELFPEAKPEVSERNNRQGLGRSQNGKGGDGKGASLEVRLKNLKSPDNRNPDMNPNPAYDTYLFMKEKYGPKAADKFARSVLEE